jgi:hypothetical protein
MQLISPMLGDENAPRGIDGKAFAIAYPSGEAVGWREGLIRFVGIVTRVWLSYWTLTSSCANSHS